MTTKNYGIILIEIYMIEKWYLNMLRFFESRMSNSFIGINIPLRYFIG